MLRTRMKKSRYVLSLALALFIFAPVLGYKAAAAELGIGFNVVPTGGKVGGNNRLWFALSQGESGIRKFQIISSSDIDQLIQITFVEAKTVDGQAIAGSEQSQISSWITPNSNSFILKPRQTRDVEIITKVPVNIEDGTYRAYLKVSASAARPSKIKSNVTQAIVNNAIAFNREVYVLVGNAESLILDFEVLDLKDFTYKDGSKHIVVEFKNLGKVPLGLKANLTLLSMDFANLSYGPYIAGSTTMLEEGDIGVADFKIPNEVAPGRYRILVQASQDSVFKNKVFEKTMTFPELGGFRVITFLVGLILLVLSIFLLRSGLRKIDVLTKLKFLIPMSLQKSFKRDDEIDIDKFLQEILVKNKRKIERAEKRQNSTKAAKLQKKRIIKSKKKSPARKQVKKKNTKIRSK